MKSWKILLLILVVAFSARLYKWRESPPLLNQDEALFHINAYCILKTGQPISNESSPLMSSCYGTLDGTMPSLCEIPFILCFGFGARTIRLAGAFYGTLAVFLVFLLARELYDQRVGLWAAGTMALTPWAIHLSRFVVATHPLPAFYGFTLWQIALARRKPKAWFGVAFGAFGCLETYATMRVVVPATLLAALVWNKASLRKESRRILMAVGLFLLLMTPFAYLSVKHFPLFMSRYKQVGVMEVGGVSTLLGMLGRYLKSYSLDVLFVTGDGCPYTSVISYGHLLWYLLPPLALGLFIVLARRSKSDVLVLAMVSIYGLPLALTDVPGHALRSAQGMVLFPVLAGLAFTAAVEWRNRAVALGRRFAARVMEVALVLCLSVGIVQTIGFLRYYYKDYPGKLSSKDVGNDWWMALDAISKLEAQRLRPYARIYVDALHINQPGSLELVHNGFDPAALRRKGIARWGKDSLWDVTVVLNDMNDRYVYCSKLDPPSDPKARAQLRQRNELLILQGDYSQLPDVRAVVRHPSGVTTLIGCP